LDKVQNPVQFERKHTMTSEKKSANPILPDPRTDEEWAAIEKVCKSDPYYIHPKEAQALSTLKEKFPEVALHSFWNRYPKDKALYAFLFARKLDVARTADVLKEHLAWRHDHGFMDEIKASHLDPKLRDSGFAFHTPGKRDSRGRLICYIFMGKFKPKEYSKGAMAKVQIWTFEHLLKTEPLDAFRFGFTYVEDISGAGLSNIQTDKAEQKQTVAMLEIFPFRIRSILVVEPGIIVRTLMRIAKFFVKKKVLQRVECVKRAELLNYMAADQLITEFGGTYKFDFQEYLRKVLAQEATESKQDTTSSSATADTDIDADAHSSSATADTDIDADAHDVHAASTVEVTKDLQKMGLQSDGEQVEEAEGISEDTNEDIST